MIADFNKKENSDFFNDKLLFKTVGIIFIVVILVLVVVDIKMYYKKRELALKLNTYQQQIEDIKKSSQILENEIINADDKDYLEKVAYEQLNQAKPGETIYSFVDSPKETDNTTKSKSFWDIKSWLGGLSNGFNWLKSKF